MPAQPHGYQMLEPDILGMSSASLAEDIIKTIPALRLYAYFLSKSNAQADDLVQDTLERAWRHRASFREGANLKAWLFGILRNRFTDEVRRRRKLVEDVDGANAARLVSPPDQHWRMQYADLLEAIAALPPATRDSLVLVMGAGLSHEEAAQVLGCPLGTLKSRVRRAREQLLSVVELELTP
jgi:RNA polymerase sigma-70 factor (ECF subfamily)